VVSRVQPSLINRRRKMEDGRWKMEEKENQLGLRRGNVP